MFDNLLSEMSRLPWRCPSCELKMQAQAEVKKEHRDPENDEVPPPVTISQV